MWLTSSFRQLSASDLAAAVAFPDADEVLKGCSSVLITLLDEDFFTDHKTIKLAHFTVKEFLVIEEGFEKGLEWFRFTAQMANRCVTEAVIECVFGSPGVESHDILGYAYYSWPRHARGVNVASDASACDEVQSKINSVLDYDNHQRLVDWIKVYYFDRFFLPISVDQMAHPMFYAALLGLQRSVMHFWKDYPLKMEPQQDIREGSALSIAACEGHVEVVKWLIDHIENPSSQFDLGWIIWTIRTNVFATLRALLEKIPKIPLSAGVLNGMDRRHMGVEKLKFLIDEDLILLQLTEDTICAARGGKILEYLVFNHTHEFPVGFRALFLVAQWSPDALQLLMESRQSEICFTEQDFLNMAQQDERRAATRTIESDSIYGLIAGGVTVTVTSKLLTSLLDGRGCSGSNILRNILQYQTLDHLLMESDVLTMAGCFEDVFNHLLKHEWENNNLTEELILAIASNCFLRSGSPDCWEIGSSPRHRIPRADGLVHRRYRRTIRRYGISVCSRNLISLLWKEGLIIDLTESMITKIVDHFEPRVFLHLVNRLVGDPVCPAKTSLCDHQQFSDLLRTHAPGIGVSPTILHALGEGYKLMLSRPVSVDHPLTRDRVVAELEADPDAARSTAKLLGLHSLPKGLRGLRYSASDFDDMCVVSLNIEYHDGDYSGCLHSMSRDDPCYQCLECDLEWKRRTHPLVRQILRERRL